MEKDKKSLPYKYELQEDVVNYLLRAVETLQIRGESAAVSMLQVMSKLRNPLNVEEIKKAYEKKVKDEGVTKKVEK